MTFVPSEEIKKRDGVSLAPMIDFLFLMMAVFASLAVTRVVLKDTEVELVQSNNEPLVENESLLPTEDLRLIQVTVLENGTYKWVTEVRDYPMQSADEVAFELNNQYEQGLIPKKKVQTQVLLKIDRRATWDPILKVLLAIQELGFEVRPLYEPEET